MRMRTVALFGVVLLLAGCSSGGNWGWYVIDPSTPQGRTNINFLMDGFTATITLSLIAAVMSMAIGLFVALPGMSSNRWVRLPSRIYVEFIRSIPLLPMLFWVFYGLPVVLNSIGIKISIDAFWGAIITLAISDSAFTAARPRFVAAARLGGKSSCQSPWEMKCLVWRKWLTVDARSKSRRMCAPALPTGTAPWLEDTGV